MKLLFLLLTITSLSVTAGEWRPFETINEATDRQSAERYETYKQHNYQEPLGGYNEPLGSSSYSTSRPGTTDMKRNYDAPRESWRDRLKR